MGNKKRYRALGIYEGSCAKVDLLEDRGYEVLVKVCDGVLKWNRLTIPKVHMVYKMPTIEFDTVTTMDRKHRLYLCVNINTDNPLLMELIRNKFIEYGNEYGLTFNFCEEDLSKPYDSFTKDYKRGEMTIYRELVMEIWRETIQDLNVYIMDRQYFSIEDKEETLC